MFKTVKKNKFESAIIVSIFIIAVTLIIYYICNALNLGELSILIALIFSIASAWGSYYYSDKIVLASCKARPATKEEDLKLVNILDALMVTAGLPKKPDLYVVEDAQPNAFATGRNPEHAVICVTTGLLEKLNYYELEGVIGTLMQLALSRKREFLADATAVEFTRNPDGLISALEKLENDPNELETANSATANMYIVNPFKKNGDKGKRKTSNLWSTHPSTADRIEALRNIR